MPEASQNGTQTRIQAGIQSGSTLIPSFRYRDAHAAVDFLERALGFTRHAVYPGPDNTVQHAELRHGSGMIMLGSASNPSLHPHLHAHPQDVEGRVTSSTYLVVPDCDPVWKSAQEAGAEILAELRTMSYGGRSFAIRDPEGYQWSVGEYSPWTAMEPATGTQGASNGA